MKKVARIAAISVMALSLTGGVAAAHSGSIGTTGPGSVNRIEHENRENRRVENDNEVRVENDNPQEARTGDARVKWNTRGGGASSGDAVNDSLFRARVSIDNGESGDAALNGGNRGSNSASINTTGPRSYNKVEFENRSDIRVENDNEVEVENYNRQEARSGDASVSGNTTGGDARSGDASNISTNETTIEINN